MMAARTPAPVALAALRHVARAEAAAWGGGGLRALRLRQRQRPRPFRGKSTASASSTTASASSTTASASSASSFAAAPLGGAFEPSPASPASASGHDDPAQQRSDRGHCVDLVRGRDLDGYLCGLLMPDGARDAYFAIRAFNAEVASVKDGGGLGRRRRPGDEGGGEAGFAHAAASIGGGADAGGMGEMDATLASRLRMQWWRDAIAEMYGDGPSSSSSSSPGGSGWMGPTYAASRARNPVVRELTRAVDRHGLTRRFLDRLVDAREADLDLIQHPTMADLARYSEDTAAGLLYLALECCGVRDGAADGAASRVGAALGLVTALRSAAYRANFGEVAIPADVMGRHGVPASILTSPPDRYAGADLSPAEAEADLALRGAVREMAHLAGTHLSGARSGQSAVPGEGRASLLPAVAALDYLRRLDGLGYDLYHVDLISSDGLQSRLGRLGTTFSLSRAWLTGVF